MICFFFNLLIYVVFVNICLVGFLMLLYLKDIVDKGFFSLEYDDDGVNC